MQVHVKRATWSKKVLRRRLCMKDRQGKTKRACKDAAVLGTHKYIIKIIYIITVTDIIWLGICFAQLRQEGEVLWATPISFNWPHL